MKYRWGTPSVQTLCGFHFTYKGFFIAQQAAEVELIVCGDLSNGQKATDSRMNRRLKVSNNEDTDTYGGPRVAAWP